MATKIAACLSRLKAYRFLCLILVTLMVAVCETAKATVQYGKGEGKANSELAAMMREIGEPVGHGAETINSELPDVENSQPIEEVRGYLLTPSTYGQTTYIAPNDRLPEIEDGPMRKKLQQKVDMHLSGAGVKELITALREIEGLNIIADEALEADAKLSIDMEGVVLENLLRYLARNMGIAFHVGKEVIWITEGENDPARGPEPEIRIYDIRCGFIPSLSGGGNANRRRNNNNRSNNNQQHNFFVPPANNTNSSNNNNNNNVTSELEDALTMLFGALGPEEFFKLYRNRNLLMVKGTRTTHKMVTKLLKTFDVQPKQVLIEAKFCSIGTKDLYQVGVNLQKLSVDRAAPGAKAVELIGDTTTSIVPGTADGGLDMQVGGILGNYEYNFFLNALQTASTFRNLSAPKITVVNNQQANIRRGEQLYYWEEWETTQEAETKIVDGNVVEVDGPPVTSPVGEPTELELGIALDVMASVGNDGETIMLHLSPSITALEEFLTYGTGGDPSADNNNNSDDDTRATYQLPRVSESSLNTRVLVNSGETVVLGGLVEDNEREEERKVPLLGDIPFVRHAFRYKERVSEPRHLLIFVTARVVDPDGRFVKVDDSLKNEENKNK